MSFRITQSMLYSRSLQDIRRGSMGIIELQEQVATGRRVNRPSDDPAAMLRILPLNSELQDLRHLSDNAAMAKETLNTGAASLQEASSAMARIKELLVQAANGTNSEGDRISIGKEVDELLKHMVGLANSKRGGSFLFGGTDTSTPPFRLIDDSTGTRVVYDGSQDAHIIDVAPGVTTSLYSPGDDFFLSIGRERTVIEGTTGAAATNSMDTGRGFGTLEVTYRGLTASTLPTGITAGASAANSTAVGVLNYQFSAGSPNTLSIDGGPALPVPVTNGAFTTSDGRTIYLDIGASVTPASGTFTSEADLSIDGGASVTAVDFTSSQIQVRNSLDNTVLNVDVSNLSRTGTDEVTYTGTFDVFTVLVASRDVLQNKAGLPAEKVVAKLQKLIGEVTGAHDKILNGLQELGIRSQNLDLLQDRVEGLIISDQESLSVVRDTDLAEAITAMTRSQFNFQASLQVGARIVQTTLLNFLT